MTYTIAQIVVIDETGDTRYRMKWPAESLARHDPALRVLNVDATHKERYEIGLHADLLVLFQSNDLDFLDIIKRRKAAGLKTLVEYNDNFYAPQPWSPIAKEWSSAALHAIYEAFMREADGVMVTGSGLQKLFSDKTAAPIHIIQNHLPQTPTEYSQLLKKKTAYPSFGWAGSLGHMADLVSLKPVIRQVLETVPGSVFHVMGNAAIPDVLGLSAERIRYTPWGGMKEYFSFWESVWVGMAPLIRTPYNECRSDIKIIEMASCGVYPVVTPLLPYEELVKRFSLASSFSLSGMAAAVVDALRNSEARINKSEELSCFVSRGRIQDLCPERLTLYRSLLPKAPGSQYAWSWQVGYHEVVEPKEQQGRTQKLLLRVQEQINKKDLHGSLAMIETEESSHPDLLLARVKLLKALNDPAYEAALLEFRRAFPQDIRGIALSIKHAHPSRYEPLWREIFSGIRNDPAIWGVSARKEICELMAFCIGQDLKTVALAEELLLHYPFAMTLRHQVAYTRERLGDVKEAKAHFDVLLQTKKRHEMGEGDIASFERGYLEAMAAALAVQAKGSFS